MIDALTVPLEDEYCISKVLRNQQIEENIKKYPYRIKPYLGTRKQSIAIVCFGPSLVNTWEKIKDFEFVMTCSGSHKFLREREIVPTYHVEVDPREHKIQMVGDDIHWSTQFLVASCCHPKYLEHLSMHNADIVLWHVYANDYVFPPEEWTLLGGGSVGLRALTLARFLGFTDIHIFGMDGSFSNEEIKHAGFHKPLSEKTITVTYLGKEYLTTQSILKCGRRIFKELEIMADITPTFYGDGLVQDMAKTVKVSKIKQSGIAFLTSKTPGIIKPDDTMETFKKRYSQAYMVHNPEEAICQ